MVTEKLSKRWLRVYVSAMYKKYCHALPPCCLSSLLPIYVCVFFLQILKFSVTANELNVLYTYPHKYEWMCLHPNIHTLFPILVKLLQKQNSCFTWNNVHVHISNRNSLTLYRFQTLSSGKRNYISNDIQQKIDFTLNKIKIRVNSIYLFF